MKYKIILLILFTLVLNGCGYINKGEEYTPNTEGHIGCQAGEIKQNGGCVPSDDSNVNLFNQDLDEFVEVQVLNEPVNGYLAKPKISGTYPGVLMIHEWWGLNDNIKEMARILANEGYVVLAIDLYDGKVAKDSTEAGQFASVVRANPQAAIEKMKSAVNYLKDNQKVSKVGSLGWCFGGGQSLQLALSDKLDATVIYYGNLTDDKNQLKNIKWPVLGIFGAEDSGIPVDSVNKFQAALNELGVKNDIYVYPGVGHAFANPSGARYSEKETLDAWIKTVEFLRSNLK